MKPTTWMISAGLVLSFAVQGASFDCGKATSEVEKLVCVNEELSAMDDQVTLAYQAALKKAPDPEALKTRQRQWLKDLNYCKTARCLEGAYWARTMALQNAEPDGEAGWARVYGIPEPKSQREKDKAAKVKEILTQHPMRPYEGIKAKNHAFCNGFYEALRTASKKITYIEPVFRTDDPTHPALGEYLACDLYEGERGPTTFQLYLLGQRGFRLYRLDMDGNPKNGLEEYLYGQEPDLYGTPSEESASYTHVDFAKCERRDGAGFSAENPTDKGYERKGINALVRYQGQYYIYDIGRGGTFNQSGHLWAYDAHHRRFQSIPPMQCIWHDSSIK